MNAILLTLAILISPQQVTNLGDQEYTVRKKEVEQILAMQSSEDLLNELVDLYHKTDDIEVKLNLQICIEFNFEVLTTPKIASIFCDECGKCGECLSHYRDFPEYRKEQIAEKLREAYEEFRKAKNINTVIR